MVRSAGLVSPVLLVSTPPCAYARTAETVSPVLLTGGNLTKRTAQHSLLGLLIFGILVISLGTAQTSPSVTPGILPYDSVSGGEIDTVSLTSGNIYLHSPLAAYSQRGQMPKLTLSIRSNTPRWGVVGTIGNGYLQPANSVSGQQAVTGPAVGLDLPAVGMVVDNSNHPCSSSYWYNMQTPDGQIYSMGNDQPTNCHGSYPAFTAGTPYGLGYRLSVGAAAAGTRPPAGTVTDRNGVLYQPSDGVVAEDTNGNEVTSSWSGPLTDQTITYTDTLGRQISDETNSNDSSGCTGPLPISFVQKWSLPGPNNTTNILKSCYVSVPIHTNFQVGFAEWSGTANLVQSIVLPNGTTWTLEYNDRDTTDPTTVNYGTVTKITLPTGGAITYTYSNIGLFYPPSRTPIRRTLDASDGTGPHSWTYSWVNIQQTPAEFNATVTDPLTNQTIVTAQYSTSTVGPQPLFREINRQIKQGSTTLLKTDTTDWTGSYPTRVTTTWPNGSVKKTERDFDSNYGQVLATREYDYGSNGPGPLLRQSLTTYLSQINSSYLSANLLDLPSTVIVQDGNGNKCAETDYAYDDPSRLSTPNPAVTTQHVAAPNNVRGNLSSLTKQLTPTPCATTASWTPLGSYINSYDTGMPHQTIDFNGNTKAYTYDTAFAGAYPTIITNALLQSTLLNYDWNTGLLISTKDPNNLITTYTYDSMFRLVTVSEADGGTQTITRQESTYPFTATLTKTINSSQNVVSTSVFDGLGRISQTQLTSDPQGTVYTDTTHDALGRVATVSNPYRTGTDPTSSPGITNYTYDALGRKTQETYPDNSVLTTAYCGSNTLVTDPTVKWRRSRVNGLGQLVEVDEPNSTTATVASTGCPGTGESIWVTAYTNDVFGNLKQVVQNGSHTRTFTYDSLSRLLTAANPETGTITYTYNPNGTVLTKKDARLITASYTYDALDRETGITYSNGDPSLTFTYDGAGCLSLTACQNIGHRTGMTDGAGSEAWAYQIDQPNLRSIHREQRTTNSSPNNITKTTTYYLDLAGNVAQLVYPTGRTVNYTYDAAGRPSTAVDSANGITYATGWKTPGTGCLANAVCYTPQGSVYNMSVGQTTSFTGLNLSETFNNRLQPNEIKASSTAGTAIDITYNFVDPTSHGNAGHVYSITNNLVSGRSQAFTYDQLNRITSAGTTATTGSTCWGYQYSYDAWGNLLSQAGWTPTYNACTQTNMGGVTADSNNHISGLTYDSSGNTQADGIYSYTFDGESQLKTAAGVTYAYDGDGRRVSKSSGKMYWYGSGGEILAETNTAGGTSAEYIFFGGKRVAMLPAGGNAQYYAEDSLGSSRIMTQINGARCYDADFTPFGAERTYTNTCAQAYKFEGKERDSETQNDDFGARYYSYRFGRWLSSDWSAVPVPVPYAHLTNPQTLNLYAMVADDPESFADLDGHAQAADQLKSSWFFDPAMPSLCVCTFHSGPQASQPQTAGQISLTLGDKKVTGTIRFGETGALGPNGVALGATIDATADCANCTWVQTVTASTHPLTTDVDFTRNNHVDDTQNSPLYNLNDKNHFYDRPYMGGIRAYDFGASFVTILGTADPKNRTFHAIGAMSWGYNTTAQGTVVGIAPHVANAAQLRGSLAVVRSEFRAWTIY
jgi:RHS repeat-associated protein